MGTVAQVMRLPVMTRLGTFLLLGVVSALGMPLPFVKTYYESGAYFAPKPPVKVLRMDRQCESEDASFPQSCAPLGMEVTPMHATQVAAFNPSVIEIRDGSTLRKVIPFGRYLATVSKHFVTST
jgi:hypothetical protein